MSANTSRKSEALNVTRPAQSIPAASSSRESGTRRSVMTIVASPIGRLR